MEAQEQLPLEDRKTILLPTPEPRHKPSPEEEREHLSPFQRVKKVMQERREE